MILITPIQHSERGHAKPCNAGRIMDSEATPKSKTLAETLPNLVNACFSGLWVETFEPDEAIREIRELARRHNWDVATWDLNDGLSQGNSEARDPLSAVQSLPELRRENDGTDNPKPLLVVFRNFHWFLKNPEIIQAVEKQVLLGKSTRTYLVILSPETKLPIELEKLFTVIDHPFPDHDQLMQIALETADNELADDLDTKRSVEAAAGMTRIEAENAFALSLIEHDRILPQVIWGLKANNLRKTAALRLYRGESPTLGGLDALTDFCERILTKRSESGERAKGVMLLGVSGIGKSAFCKRLGSLANRPVIILDVGALMNSLVGQTEAALRGALKMIDAMGPCIVMIDEVEKTLPTGGNDGGVSTRLFGTLLTWLNDRESDSFVVCTANDIRRLPPEFTRAERFDGIFFLDLPDEDSKAEIWSIYENEYGISGQDRPDDAGWTGAEIKACCRLSRLLDLPLKQAAVNVVPVAQTASESIFKLREWASGRCLDARKRVSPRPKKANAATSHDAARTIRPPPCRLCDFYLSMF